MDKSMYLIALTGVLLVLPASTQLFKKARQHTRLKLIAKVSDINKFSEKEICELIHWVYLHRSLLSKRDYDDTLSLLDNHKRLMSRSQALHMHTKDI